MGVLDTLVKSNALTDRLYRTTQEGPKHGDLPFPQGKQQADVAALAQGEIAVLAVQLGKLLAQCAQLSGKRLV